MARVDGMQMAVALGIEGDGRDDADAHAKLHIGLDHVRIHGGEHDVGRKPRAVECRIDVRAARVARLIGDDRVRRQLLQRDAAAILLEQRMARRHDDGVRPAVARQGDELIETRERFGRHADVGFAGKQHLRNLLGRTLAQMQRHIGAQFAEIAHHLRQCISSLRVGGRDDQTAALALREIIARVLEVFGFEKQALDDGQQHLAGQRHASQALARAHEDFHA